MKKILLIDDNDEARENSAEILTLSNYTVLTAKNGKQGVELALKELPDIIICDIMMPVLDGYGVIHSLSKHPETASIPFIFLTAKSERTDFRKGMSLGADDYITKPFDGTDLLNAVEARLKKSEALRQILSQDGINGLLNDAARTGMVRLTSEEHEVNHYKKKQILFAEGQRPVALYYIMSGKVLLRKRNDDMKEFVTDILTTGDFIGYTAILEEINYKETAEFLEDTALMLIPRKEFLDIIASDNHVARQFIRLLARNVDEKEMRLLNIAYDSLRKKVANGLLQLSEKFKEDGRVIEISRENLANVIGSAKESLIRTLSDFKSEHLIDLRGNKIVILNESKLANLIS